MNPSQSSSFGAKWPSAARFRAAAVAAVIAFACGLAASTYSVFGHTWDEPEHLAAGLKILASGEYPYDVQHPPLARLAIALGPYIDGARPYGNAGPSGEQEGRDILYRSGHYDEYLRLARLGTLPFLAVLLMVTWLWARRLVGETYAIFAVLFVVTTPPLLGHAALATLDVPMAAMTMLALYLLTRWLDSPSLARAAVFGVAAGVAAGTKLSAIPFVACTTLVWLCALWLRPATASTGVAGPNATLLLRHGISALLLAAITLIACYGSLSAPVGAARLVDSLAALHAHNVEGHWSYLFGEQRRTGWWYFYLVVLGVKTPLPLLMLGLSGIGLMLWRGWHQRCWEVAAPALAFLAVLIFSSAYSHINIGVRHVIVLFPLLALAAAYALSSAWQRFHHPVARGALALLLVWQTVGLTRAHPDDLAYFNELAGAHPERIVIDSDLDWGQDLRRLEAELAERHITEVSVLYRGTADLSQEPLPRWQRLPPKQRVTGWIAVSVLAKNTAERPADFAWLDALQPVAQIGKSFCLYFVPK